MFMSKTMAYAMEIPSFSTLFFYGAILISSGVFAPLERFSSYSCVSLKINAYNLFYFICIYMWIIFEIGRLK